MTQNRQVSHFASSRVGVRIANTCSATLGVFIAKTSYVRRVSVRECQVRPGSAGSARSGQGVQGAVVRNVVVSASK